MNEAVIERSIAFVGAIVVGITAIVQLKNDWRAHGMDADVTKLLLGLMAFGCGLALLAAVNVLGARS
jgi:hypothetical protein